MEATMKKKRLGMWNRLAIVGAFIAIFVWPVYLSFKHESELSGYRFSELQACRSQGPGWDDNEHTKACLQKQRIRADEDASYIFSKWLPELMLIYAIAYGVLYLLIFAVIKVFKWVLAGRDKNESEA
nr:hypothetical protein [Stenotrophomonas geniculata]